MKLKNSPHFSLTSFPTILVTLISFILISVLFIAVHADAASDTTPSVGKHLVTIHDADTTEGIMTKDSTLRQVFHDAGIPITDQDLVEPGLDTPLTASDYQVNVYRARPIVIVDGNIHMRVMSPYRTGDQIASHAGVTLHDEDITTMAPNRDIIAAGAGLTLTIDRATPFTLYLYGKKVPAYTQATTVGGMLEEKGVKLGPKDDTSMPLDAAITAGMTVKVWRNGVQTVTNKETIHFKVKQIQDNDQPVGYHKIQTPGVNGEKMVTYQLTMQNGEIVKKKIIQSVVTKHASDQVETIGTKISLPPGTHSDWMREAGISTSDFGYVNYIFNHESGWNPAAANAAGYYGLGQTSLSNITNACGAQWASKPVCQIQFFDGYKNRYGSWQAAYNFKAANGWW